MDDFVSLAELAAELGLDRSHTRDCVRRSGIRPRKVRSPGSVMGHTLVITHEEADHIRAAQRRGGDVRSSDWKPGCFFVVRLVPELDSCRVKLGFAHDVRARLGYLRLAAPTAALVRCWPCKQSWVGTVIDCLTAVGCSRISADVFQCDDVDRLVRRAAELFAHFPPPDRQLPVTVHVTQTRDAICDTWCGPTLRGNTDR
jgi:hypothetical protein